MENIEVLFINGSPRKDGISMSLASYVMRSVEKEGGKVKTIHLIDNNIKWCEGCVSVSREECNRERCRKLNDDVDKIFKILLKADALVFVTPVYWYAPSGLLKNFIDRLTSLENEGKLLDGKIGGFVVTAQEDGAMMTILSLMGTLNDMGIIFPPYAFTYSVGFEDVSKDKEAIEYAERLGKNIVRMGEMLRNMRWL